MSILNGSKVIRCSSTSVATLKSIGIRLIEMCVEHDPSTPLFGHVFVSVLSVHMVFTERTSHEIELSTVDTEKFSEKLCLGLLRNSV